MVQMRSQYAQEKVSVKPLPKKLKIYLLHDTLKITHFRLMRFKEKLEEKHDSHLYLHYEKKPINTFLYFSSGLKKEFQTLIICLVHNLPWARGSYVRLHNSGQLNTRGPMQRQL